MPQTCGRAGVCSSASHPLREQGRVERTTQHRDDRANAPDTFAQCAAPGGVLQTYPAPTVQPRSPNPKKSRHPPVSGRQGHGRGNEVILNSEFRYAPIVVGIVVATWFLGLQSKPVGLLPDLSPRIGPFGAQLNYRKRRRPQPL